jgi:DNA-directed RNA polymerase specialized sigma24 family protein
MMGTFLPVADADDVVAAADVELIQRVHRRDPAASAELWRRHYRHALAATEAIGDSEDPALVADAFRRVEEGIVRGERPRGSFRAHLLTQVRATAVAAGSASGARARVAPRDRAAADAYGELFSDQQELLWYSEIEGMTPDAIAPRVHAAPTAVTKLSAGARRELRRIWLKARPAEPETAAECAWTRAQLPALAEASLTTADAERAQEHLAECRACAALVTEVDRLPSRLAAGVLPGVLGAAGAAAYRTTVLDTGVRTADIPPVPGAAPAPGPAATAAPAAAGSAMLASATAASPAPGDVFDAGTPAEVAARALSAPAALTPTGRAAGRAAATRRPRAGRRAFSGVAITAVLVTGAVVATGAVAVSVLPTLGTQDTTRTIDADTRLTASETTPTPRPTRSAITAPSTTEDPPAPLLPEAGPPTSGGTDRVGTAPRATTPRTPTAPFAPRDVFQSPAPSPSAPTPAPVRPTTPTTPTTPATPTTPTGPTTPTTPTTPDPVRPTPTPDPVQPTNPPTDPEPTTPPVTTPPTNPPTTPPVDPEPAPEPEPEPEPEPQPEPTLPIADLLDQLFTPPPATP